LKDARRAGGVIDQKLWKPSDERGVSDTLVTSTHQQAIMKHVLLSVVVILVASSAGAQAAKPAPKRMPTCARAIKMYEDVKQIPAPHDTVDIPAPDKPVIVNNETELEAAELALKERAASVGATGVLAHTVRQDDGAGNVEMRRSTIGIFVRADSAAAQKLCTSK
jgi:hypothetical protein